MWFWPVLPSTKPNSLLPVVFICPQLLIVYRMPLDKIGTLVSGTPKSFFWLSLSLPQGCLFSIKVRTSLGTEGKVGKVLDAH